LDTDWDRLGRLTPREKVAICIEMTEVCFRTSSAGIRAQHPDLTEEELVIKFQERIDWLKRSSQRGNSDGNSRGVH